MELRRILARSACALALLVAAGCGPIAAGVWLAVDGGGGSSGGGAGTGAGLSQVSAPVGPNGGAVVLGQTAVIVPPGALNTTIDLVVATGTDVAGGEYVKAGQAIRLGPAGQTFSSPVTVTLAFDPTLIPVGKSVADLIVQKRNDQTMAIENLTPSSVDITSNRITVTLTSFSTVQPVILVGVDPARSRVQASPSTVAPGGTDVATITVTLLNPGGQPIPGRTVILSTVGAVTTGVTISQPAQPTDANGVTQGTISSIQTTTVTVIAQVGTTVLDQQATVSFTNPPPPPPPPPPPALTALTSITPEAGPAGGGTPVTVVGVGFSAGTVVRIWGEPLVNQVVVDATTITGEIPASREGFQGPCNVVASSGGVDKALPWGWHYGVTLDEITPAGAPVGGGTPITIRGGGFVPGTIFTIDGVAVPGAITDLNTFQGTAPAGVAGPADVVVTAGADSATLTDGFTYGSPTVTGVSPASGFVGGGGIVQITGTGFYPGAVATIGSAQLTNVEVLSPTLLVGVTGAGTLGAQDVQVTTEGGSDTQVSGFTCAALAVDEVSPNIVRGGLTVTLRGGGFDPTPGNNAVTFGGVAATVLTATATELTVVVPTNPVAGSVVVGVGGSFSAPRAYALAPVDLGAGTSNPMLSPDGSRVFYLNGGNLYLLDRLTGATEQVKDEGAYHVTRNGRYVSWHSATGSLVKGDPSPDGNSDAFVFDRKTGRTIAVSVDIHGRQTDTFAENPVVSEDGRYVVFYRGGSAGLYDRQTNRSSLVLIGGATFAQTWEFPWISADGLYLFLAIREGQRLTPEDTNSNSDIYRYELATGVWTLVSKTAAGGPLDNVAYHRVPRSTPDGRFVMWGLTSSIPGANTRRQWLKDMQTGALERVDTNEVGPPPAGPGGVNSATISDDGRYVAFSSYSPELVLPDATMFSPDVYLRDVLADTTARISLDAAGAQIPESEQAFISADGRYVGFYVMPPTDRAYLVPVPR